MPAAPPVYRLVRAATGPVAAPALDPSQQAVVDHPGGPLLVLAGPGTGKTTTLVEAVVDRVARGAAPDQVLVLTFSRKAADELRERITSRLGRTTVEPAAYTFHAWCYALVRAHCAAVRPPRLLSQPERDVRIRELLTGHAVGAGLVNWPAGLRPALATRGFAREVAALFDRARERGLDGAALRHLGEREQRPLWAVAGAFLDEYLDVLDARGEVDYSGLVAAATDLLARDAVGRATRERYRCVFVDEYQDTDQSQERLLQALAGAGRDLVVVGDPDQSIYAFRGADVENILQFRHRFPTSSGAPAPVLTLDTSRRAGAALLAASRAVAERIPTPGLAVGDRRSHRLLRPVGTAADAPPEVRLFPTTAEQVAGVADVVRRAHLQDGLAWRDIAVLVRSGTRSLPVLRRALVAAGVPVSVAADDLPVARDPAVAPLLIGLRVADLGLESLPPDDARTLLLSPLARAQPSQLRMLGRRLRALERAGGAAVPGPSSQLIRDVVVDPADLSTIEAWVAAPVRRLHNLLASAGNVLRAGATPEEALWTLWADSGWAERLTRAAAGTGGLARTADRDLDAVVALFAAAARLEEREPRAGVATLLDELGMQQIPAAPQEEAGATDAVRLLTAHRSKGLEWELVVIADVQEDLWPDLRRRCSLLEADAVGTDADRRTPTLHQLLVEERRLFYVALTRARRRVVLTAVSAVDEAGARPSRFLEEVVDDLPPTGLAGVDVLSPASLVARLRRVLHDDAASAALQHAAAARLARLAAATSDDGTPLVPAATPAAWWGLADWTPGRVAVRHPGEPLRLSGSAVAGYDACPLRWFLEREVNAGTATTAAQGFGSVVHALAQLVADGTLPADTDVLVEQLDTVWSALGFEAPWQAAREREEARAALDRLLRWLDAAGGRGFASEAAFEVSVGDVVLRGAVDRLERDAQGRVHIVDFKTARTPKGKAEVAQDPQLSVYQLALREGGFVGVAGAGAVGGGAELVYLRRGTRGGLPVVRGQDPLPPEGPTWADELLQRTAKGIRAEHFAARANDGCGMCAFRGVCPAQDAGEQVVQ